MAFRAIFFDRDGIVNRRMAGDYIRNAGEFELLPGIAQGLADLHAKGFRAVVITNQRGIALGLMSHADLAAVHERMQDELRSATGHVFDAIYYCPHDHADNCACRKPKPGMILQAGNDLDIDLARSWMIGDTESDIEAGLAAGCRTLLVAPESTRTKAEILAPTLTVAIERMLQS